VGQYFREKIEAFGATPQGVDYNGIDAQQIRFEQLIKLIDPTRPFSVIDYGCGYGAMLDFLRARGWLFEYRGVDLVEEMVAVARQAHPDDAASFTTNDADLAVADYVLAGSIFNNKLTATDGDWQALVFATLGRMNSLCSRGFAFNMLTKYSDADRMAQRPDLFYGDPLVFFDYCKRTFSRNVALLHDYDLYDFTILVRKA
jgi:SAM-dependent methyltransferase